MSVESFVADNLVTATEDLITSRELQLEAGESVVRGEILKKGTTGLVAVAADTDTPYTVALQTVDATLAAKPLVYALEGSFLGSEMTAASGTVADFKDGLRDVGILVF